jgi:hypothetical protein
LYVYTGYAPNQIQERVIYTCTWGRNIEKSVVHLSSINVVQMVYQLCKETFCPGGAHLLIPPHRPFSLSPFIFSILIPFLLKKIVAFVVHWTFHWNFQYLQVEMEGTIAEISMEDDRLENGVVSDTVLF